MKLIFERISAVMECPPAEVLERLTPWIFVVLGGLFLLLMAYSYFMAPRGL